MNYERPELLDMLAASHALGTMPARAARRFASLLEHSAAARRALARWNDLLAPLSVAVAPVQPPQRVWEAIAGRVAPRAAASKPGWRERLAAPFAARARLGAGLGLGSALGAALMFGVVNHDPHSFGMHGVDASLPASYVGILADAEGRAVLAAGSHRRGATMTIRMLRPLAVPAGRVARLWALPQDGGAPVAIANLPAGGNAMIALGGSAEERFAGVTRLAVSFEQDAAAAAPKAPYVLSGHCVKFW